MTRDLARDALKEGRTTAIAILITSMVWAVTAGSVRNSLLVERQARELAAWLVLREHFSPADASALLDEKRDHAITCIKRIVPIQSGTEFEDCVPIWLALPWLGEKTQSVALEPIPHAPFGFTVGHLASSLPISGYAVVPADAGRLWIFPTDVPLDNLRAVYNAALRDQKAVPQGWAATRVLLRSRGWSGDTAEDLKLSDPIVSRVISDAFTATYSISNIAVSPRLYPIVISALLAIFTFILTGPILVLRQYDGPQLDDSWTMLVLPVKGGGKVLRPLQVLAAVLAPLLPLSVAITQIRLLPLLDPVMKVALIASWVGPVAATFALVMFGFSVLRHRRPVEVPVAQPVLAQ
jgi:hypothetical protein